MNKILLVEDDMSLIDGLKYSLEKNRFSVDNARTIQEAFDLYRSNAYELLLLDVALPDGSGFDLCKEIRKNSEVPIIFLTASDEETSIVMGLDMGGDDYVVKPFKLNELISRVNALLRRSLKFTKEETVIEANGIRIDMLEKHVWKNNRLLELTFAEYKLLCYVMQNPNRILTREMILDRLWDGNGKFVDDNTLSVYIRRLRSKIEDNPSTPKLLLTERGFGYKWNVK